MSKGQPQRNRGFDPKSDKRPRMLDDPINYDEKNFSWRVHDSYIDYGHPQFGWDKVGVIALLKNIIQGLHSYEGFTWRQVRCKEHCHPWELDRLPNELSARLRERNIDIDQLFQIGLGSVPRVIGYKDRCIFYLIWYDPQHKIYPMKAE